LGQGGQRAQKKKLTFGGSSELWDAPKKKKPENQGRGTDIGTEAQRKRGKKKKSRARIVETEREGGAEGNFTAPRGNGRCLKGFSNLGENVKLWGIRDDNGRKGEQTETESRGGLKRKFKR